ncbi:hypothetical protein NMG60_11015527 [Bertholletia excelsa]
MLPAHSIYHRPSSAKSSYAPSLLSTSHCLCFATAEVAQPAKQSCFHLHLLCFWIVEMSSTIGRRLGLSSAGGNMEEEANHNKPNYEKQGIVSILVSYCTEAAKAASLRRTLSADMSSRKWLAQSGFKNTASLELAFSSPSANSDSSSWEEEEECDGNKTTEDVAFRAEQPYIWSSIQTDRTNEDPSNLPPYVHPLVKRSASSLSKQSLEICTESLGSETGSHGFSSYPESEIGEPTEEGKQVQPEQQLEKDVPYFFDEMDKSPAVKQSFSNRKRSSSLLLPSFPPPLSSLARGDGPSIQMQSHRRDGRFVLEARSINSQSCFHAHRQDGRLLLAFANHSPTPDRQALVLHQDPHHVEELEEDIFFQYSEEDEDDDHDDEDEEEKNQTTETGIGKEQAQMSSIQATKFGSSTVMVKKLMKGEVEVGSTVLAQSMPTTAGPMVSSPPATATATVLHINAYNHHMWRSSPLISRRCPLPLAVNNNTKRNETLPLVRGCKQPRRSLFMWQTNCIATS